MTIKRFSIDVEEYKGAGGMLLASRGGDGKVRIVETNEFGSQVAEVEYAVGDPNAEELLNALEGAASNILRLRPIIATDIYYVDVPSDYGTEEERMELAIHIAREESGVYAIPSEWEAREVDGDCDEVVVIRRRHADPKFPEEHLTLPKGEEFD